MMVSPSAAKRAAVMVPVRNVIGVNCAAAGGPPRTTPRATSDHHARQPRRTPIVKAVTAISPEPLGQRARAAEGTDALLSPLHCSAAARSAALCQRSSGSFARHLSTILLTPAGTSDRADESGCGSLVRMAA